MRALYQSRRSFGAADDGYYPIGTGYYVGPGGWIYNVTPGGLIFAVWSPVSGKDLSKQLSGDTAKKAIEELQKTRAPVYSTLERAKSAQQIAYPKSTRATAPASSPSTALASISEAPGTAPFYQNPWFLGGATVVVAGIVAALVFVPRKK